MEQLSKMIDWNLVIWTLINFAVLFGALLYFLWKPILKMLSDREHKIAADLEHAENSREEAVRARQEYEERLTQAQQQVQEMLRKAEQQANEIHEQTLAQAHEEAERLLFRARETISNERDAAIASLRTEVADLAIAVAAKIVEREFSAEDQRRLTEEFLEQVGGAV